MLRDGKLSDAVRVLELAISDTDGRWDNESQLVIKAYCEGFLERAKVRSNSETSLITEAAFFYTIRLVLRRALASNTNDNEKIALEYSKFNLAIEKMENFASSKCCLRIIAGHFANIDTSSWRAQFKVIESDDVDPALFALTQRFSTCDTAP